MTHIAGGLQRPDVSPEQASKIALEAWGIRAQATELGSNQDRNFVLEDETGTRWVLRVDNEVFPDSARDAQHAAIAACAAAGIPVPEMVAGLDGKLTQVVDGHACRLSTFVAGDPMVDLGYFSPQVMRSFGSFAARSVIALANLEHEGLNRVHQWDMRVAYEETMHVIDSISNADERALVQDAADRARDALSRWARQLPVQPIHGDLTDDNVMGTREADSRVHPHTLIDFGDLSLGWRIAELAVTLTSMLHHTGARPLHALHTAEAFAAELHRAGMPLNEAEARALWPLVVLRTTLLVASGRRQVELEGDNEYALERLAGEQTMFEQATQFDLVEMTEHVLAVMGQYLQEPPALTKALPEIAGDPLASLLPTVTGEIAMLDPGVESVDLAGGSWLNADAETGLVARALGSGAECAVFPHGVFRLTRTEIDSHDAPDTYPIDTEIHVAATEPVRVSSPVAGRVLTVTPDQIDIALDTDDDAQSWVLELSGVSTTLEPGVAVQVASDLGVVEPQAGAARLAIGMRRSDVDVTRLGVTRDIVGGARFARADRAGAFARLFADPAPLLGLPELGQHDEARAEQERREQIFAAAQERYYERPMQIERGWRHHLVDTTGRAYIDMVNNVTGLGHGHPVIADAVNQQIRILGTNSRFLYRSLAEYSERLLEMLPAGSGLDTVLLVNSGSEAVDLGLRLAQAASGRKTVIALREAYHGWTMASDAVTTSAFDNPYALESRPDWVHIADVPNTYRGTYRGEGAGEKYLADFEADVARLTAEGRPIAGFICESVLGNAGGVTLPDGYLERVYEIVREAGGVTIADEVQVGFGRMGTSFWGFEQSSVTPDIITIAKPMGNGFPIGGVITSKKIADALSSQGQFFSSAGGNPVSCQVGLAVLDAMRDEELQENARVVGEHLVRGFERLREKHSGGRANLIGPVHGQGLYLGVELVRDHETLEPATAEADAICERLRELGVIVLTTSERSNVLKIKPPLCLTRESADTVIEAVDRVLTEGW